MIKFLILLVAICAMNTQAAVKPDDVLVGVYYFGGWWKQTPNKYIVNGHDWRQDYPQRAATCGQYIDQATMDREIIAASSHGVDFFQMLWYWPGEPSKPTSGETHLNDAIHFFMQSPDASRMKFTVEDVNHPPFVMLDDAAWEKSCRLWCAIMRHPSYLKIDGRPVFKIHGLAFFLKQSGGPEGAARRIKTLRDIAHEMKLNDPLISSGITAGPVPPANVIQPFDFLTTYMDVPKLPQRAEPYPYERLIGLAKSTWLNYAEHSSKPYVPYVPAGWDPRPWHDPRPSFEMPTSEQWTDALKQAQDMLDSHETLGVLTSRGRQKMILIYAWNEFGEGGIVAPTAGRDMMMLKGIQSIFTMHSP